MAKRQVQLLYLRLRKTSYEKNFLHFGNVSFQDDTFLLIAYDWLNRNSWFQRVQF